MAALRSIVAGPERSNFVNRGGAVALLGELGGQSALADNGGCGGLRFCVPAFCRIALVVPEKPSTRPPGGLAPPPPHGSAPVCVVDLGTGDQETTQLIIEPCISNGKDHRVHGNSEA